MKKSLKESAVMIWHICAALFILIMLHDFISSIFHHSPMWMNWN